MLISPMPRSAKRRPIIHPAPTAMRRPRVDGVGEVTLIAGSIKRGSSWRE
jgi:hypothetical protein